MLDFGKNTWNLVINKNLLKIELLEKVIFILQCATCTCGRSLDTKGGLIRWLIENYWIDKYRKQANKQTNKQRKTKLLMEFDVWLLLCCDSNEIKVICENPKWTDCSNEQNNTKTQIHKNLIWLFFAFISNWDTVMQNCEQDLPSVPALLAISNYCEQRPMWLEYSVASVSATARRN